MLSHENLLLFVGPSTLKTGEVAQRADARQEEVGAAFYNNEALEIVDARP